MPPLCDLHIHLLGAIREEDLLSLIGKYVPTYTMNLFRPAQKTFLDDSEFAVTLFQKLKSSFKPAELINELLSFKDLKSFFASYLIVSSFVQTESDFELLVKGVISRLKNSEIDYAEITVSPTLYTHKEISLEGLLHILKRYKSKNIKWLLDPIRNRGGEEALSLLKRILEIDREVFSGVNLAGDEYSHPVKDFRAYYELARKHDLGATLHIGETTPYTFIQEPLELPLNRIGHGLSAVKDPELVKLLIVRDITLELCPSGNIRTGLYPSLAEHPIHHMIDAGLKVTINSDDPFFFNTSVPDEFVKLQEIGLAEKISAEFKENSLKAAFEF